ncbi:MAG TPA: hypothetical protein VGG64_26495 [Pirellulales bacterium]
MNLIESDCGAEEAVMSPLSDAQKARLQFATAVGWRDTDDEHAADAVIAWAERVAVQAIELFAIIDGDALPVGVCDCCNGIVCEPVEDELGEEGADEYQNELEALINEPTVDAADVE